MIGDPRIGIIKERLKNARSVIAVSSGKGGVGKSLVASALALVLARKGLRVGLFDLDFTSPSTHLILGVGEAKPTEDKGLIPPEVHGLKYMSIIYYSGNHATPLRGVDVSNALIELLSVTRWGELDVLIIDMPPGLGDATLDVVRLIQNIKFLVVTTSSQLAFETVKKLLSLLGELNVKVLGVVENMKMNVNDYVKQQVQRLGTPFLGEIPFDAEIERAIGSANKLLETTFVKKMEAILKNLNIN
ncbi:MAG: P-loop NTPase [Candidatus Bathyarchaeia archaeon]